MWGPPKDVEGQCNARLYFGDDYGDNMCTICCNLKEGHAGEHKEVFMRDGSPVVITWKRDESMICKECAKRKEIAFSEEGVCLDCLMGYKYEGFEVGGVIYESPYKKGSYKDRYWRRGQEIYYFCKRSF